MNERILITGASIAGLTLAHWLARRGFRPTVVERAPAPRPGGNGVDVRDHAADVLDRMGLMSRVRRAATDVRGIRFVDARGRTVARVGTAQPGAVEIMRGDLTALLRESADVEYLFGDAVRELRPDEDGVTAGFEHAASRRFDLVVGADGTHSTVRRLVFGPEERFLRHRDHYFAFADADAALGEDRWITMYNEPGLMAGLYRSGNHAQAKAYFIFRSAPIAYDFRDVGEHRRLVRAAFEGRTAWRIPQLLAAALSGPEFYFDALTQVEMPSWSAGRVVLAGDAAWCASPASGAGAELAVVGAYRLAGELAAAGGDHRVAFARYEASHRPLVERRRRIGPNVRLMVPRTHGGRWVRDGLARLPLLRAAGAASRILPARAPEPLPAYPAALG